MFIFCKATTSRTNAIGDPRGGTEVERRAVAGAAGKARRSSERELAPVVTPRFRHVVVVVVVGLRCRPSPRLSSCRGYGFDGCHKAAVGGGGQRGSLLKLQDSNNTLIRQSSCQISMRRHAVVDIVA